MEAPQYDILADVEDSHWWWRGRREIISEVIKQYLPTVPVGGLRIAEVGCGSGGNLSMLARYGDVLGAEMDTGALDHLRRKHGDKFHAITHRIPEPLPQPVHVLCLFDVLEHVQDDRGAMAWAAAHLVENGIVVVTVPAFRFLWTEQDDAVHHFRRYTRAGLAGVLPATLEPVHLTYFNSVLFAPILAVRSVMRLLPRRNRPPRSHLGEPPGPINSLLYRIFRAERHVVPTQRLPVGVSLLLVGRRRTPPA